MADDAEIVELVNHVVTEVFAAHLPQFREDISRQVLEALGPVLKQHTSAAQKNKEGESSVDLLNTAVSRIYESSSQSDILKALLDGTSEFAARSALFVVKGNALNPWRSAGFADESGFKRLTLDALTGLAASAIRDREAVSASATEFNSDFIRIHGSPSDGNANVLPLVVRGKVAALIYSDAGTDKDGKSNISALRLLARAASSWLEINALRKAAGGGETSAAESHPAESRATEMPEPPAAPVAASAPASEPKRDEEAQPEMSKEDQDLHKKAKRFARLLVDEIKLYNPAKVAEGKQKKDLYERLKEDIEKSRSTYEKRYGSTSAGKADYFNAEVVRILGENDPSVLGSGFAQ
jgi:hypothetical protein